MCLFDCLINKLIKSRQLFKLDVVKLTQKNITLLTVTQNQSAVRPISCRHYWIWKTCGWHRSIYWLFFLRHMSTLHLFVPYTTTHSSVNRDIFFSCSLVAELSFFILKNTMNNIYIKINVLF